MLDSGYVGISAAAAALGVKKAGEAALTRRSERKELTKKREEEKQRAKNFLSLLSDKKSCVDLAQRLQRQLELYESGIEDVDRFKNSVDEITC